MNNVIDIKEEKERKQAAHAKLQAQVLLDKGARTAETLCNKMGDNWRCMVVFVPCRTEKDGTENYIMDSTMIHGNMTEEAAETTVLYLASRMVQERDKVKKSERIPYPY